MSSAVGSLGGRIDSSGTTLGVAVGDLVLIGLFVVAGELRHGYSLAAQPERVVGTAIPFLIGWVLASVLVGVYTPSVYRALRPAVGRTVVAWVGAALVGQALRATSLFHGNFALAFVFVSLGIGLVLLVPWRAAVAVLADRV